MSSKQVVVVFGATGSQGGSGANYLLEDGSFAVRVVTRNADSASAQVWSLYPTIGDMIKMQAAEVPQGKALINAAKAVGVQHFVWSPFERVVLCGTRMSRISMGKQKTAVDDYLKASGIPRTSLYTSAYMEHLIRPISADLKMPEGSCVPFFSVDQMGGWALEAIKNPDKWIGKDMHLIGEHVPLTKLERVLAKSTGRKDVVKALTPEEFEAMGKSEDPFVKELLLNTKFYFEKCQPENSLYDLELALRGYPQAHDFEAFVTYSKRFKNFVESL
ncbi:NAD(P)-binding protein [Exidia glandulosa HHB12029]|uniref:NAD(P)-binding protein n=1 Tax=Exidia glandulosa HHB12029 TaxID=1314781 RepID=A0A165KQZ1_EXIGL|nr:NAD(P)-binding protein [Exidia glandulosa HHB12029]